MKTAVLSGILTLLTLPGMGCRTDIGERRNPKTDDAAAPSVINPTPVLQGGVTVTWKPDNFTGTRGTFDSQLTLTNNRSSILGSTGWKLYFSSARAILDQSRIPDDGLPPSLARQGLKCERADAAGSGDYWVLEPLPSFKPIPPGSSRLIHMLAAGSAILKSDSPAGFHLFMGSTPIAVFATVDLDATNSRQTNRSADDAVLVQTPRLRYEENSALSPVARGARGHLLPAPLSLTVTGGQYILGSSFDIQFGKGLDSEAAFLRSALGDILGGSSLKGSTARRTGVVALSLNPRLDVTGDGNPDPEGYTLAVTGTGVKIVGTDKPGVFYAIQTLRQLIPVDAYRAAASQPVTSVAIPKVSIADAPLFHYRGMLLDVARHFASKDTVKKLIDLLAAHKINKFHFHLSDDEGWRLEIPGIPELTEYGARRGYDPQEHTMLHFGLGSGSGLGADDGIAQKPTGEIAANGGTAPRYQGFEVATVNFVGEGSGYYTAAEFEEILAYAAERHIDVIPEFDMPAHSRAAVKSMEYRYRRYRGSDEAKAMQYRLIDRDDTTVHRSVQGYTDNLINPCLESTYAFIEKIVAEVKARYEAAHVRLAMFHVGGDEPPEPAWWTGSPACQASATWRELTDQAREDGFFRRVSAVLTAAGASMVGWDDVIQKGLRLDGFVSMPWHNVWGEGAEDQAYKQVNAGQPVILAHATNLYLDLAYNKDPDEPGLWWGGFVDEQKTFEYQPFDIFSIATKDRLGRPIPASKWAGSTRLDFPQTRAKERNRIRSPNRSSIILSETAAPNILGLEGLLWGENRKTPQLLEYMAFPKMLGVAERAWNRHVPTTKMLAGAWNEFVNTLGQVELPRLDYYRSVDVRRELPQPRPLGVNYRIPMPGALIDGGQLLANARYPGMAIEFSTDLGRTWTVYTGPISVSVPVLVRSKTSAGRTSRVARLE